MSINESCDQPRAESACRDSYDETELLKKAFGAIFPTYRDDGKCRSELEKINAEISELQNEQEI